MSTTQIPPGAPVTPADPASRREGDIYDSRNWESAYRELHDAPALLLQLQDDVSRSRKREAFWISVAVHLTLVLLIVNSTRFLHLIPRGAVVVNPSIHDKDMTFLELPPDAEKIPKPPDTNKISDQNRVATRKAPQLNREELKKILSAGRAGRPGQNAPAQQQPAPQAQAAPPQQAPQETPPPKFTTPEQAPKLQTPPAPKPSFNTNTLSAGSSIEEAARAALANRGNYAGDSGNYGSGVGGRQPTARMGPMDVLSDTMGVDFGPYLQRVLHDVRMNWYNLIPEVARAPLMKKGKLSIEFAITKDGKVAGMKLVSSSSDVALDRGAWGGITASNPFPPLPKEFGGQYLALRFTFFYNPDKSDLQ
jgi:TonB family protein